MNQKRMEKKTVPSSFVLSLLDITHYSHIISSQLDKLQGPEALNKPGREGQTLMINRSGTVEVYQYSGGSWQSLGSLLSSLINI